ncbi:MAG TPA: hypothetical protein DEV93_11580 [Chloroflexi bacterium]|nr:hypothetical protein [Chloroflexota bacterium]
MVRPGAEEYESLTRRTLLLIVIAVIIVLALVFVVRGRGSSSPPVPTVTPRPSGQTAAKIKQQLQHAQLVSFAHAILPDLTKSAATMDHTAAAVATAHSRLAQFNICNSDSDKVDTQRLDAESVQWPPGGTPARKWRHKIIGIYHVYFGAIVECRNAFDTGDSGQAASAVSDLAASARHMTAEENYARSLIGK